MFVWDKCSRYWLNSLGGIMFGNIHLSVCPLALRVLAMHDAKSVCIPIHAELEVHFFKKKGGYKVLAILCA